MSASKSTSPKGTATTFIYALVDPLTGEIRYIGKADDPQVRFLRHINDNKRETSHKANWIRSLSKGLRPVLQLIDEVLKTEWQAAEAAYIQFYRAEGCSLTNLNPGGDGGGSGEDNLFFGKKHSPETKMKMSAAALKRPAPVIPAASRSKGEKHYLNGKHLAPETKAKLSAALSGPKHPKFGKPVSSETRAKISAALKGEKHFYYGKKISPEILAKRSAAMKGRIFSSAHLAALKAAAARKRYSSPTLPL